MIEIQLLSVTKHRIFQNYDKDLRAVGDLRGALDLCCPYRVSQPFPECL